MVKGGGVGWGGRGGYGFMLRPPSAQMVHAITQKALDGLFSNLVHTVVVIVPRTGKLCMVMCQRSRSHHYKIWLFLSFSNLLLLTPFCPQTSCEGYRNIIVHWYNLLSVCRFVTRSGLGAFAGKPLISLSSNLMDEPIIGITRHG